MRVDHADAVVEDPRLRLAQLVRRQAPLGATDGHGPPGRVQPDAEPAGGVDLVLQPRAVGEEVEVVRRQGAARERQLGETHEGGEVDLLRPHARPDRVERLEPAEEQRVLPGGDGAGQGLEQVVVGVDEARRDHAAGGMDDLVGLSRQVGGGADLLDHAIAGEEGAVRDLPAGGVHGHEDLGMAEEEGAHGAISCGGAAPAGAPEGTGGPAAQGGRREVWRGAAGDRRRAGDEGAGHAGRRRQRAAGETGVRGGTAGAAPSSGAVTAGRTRGGRRGRGTPVPSSAA